MGPHWIVNDISSGDGDDYGQTHEHILLMGKGLRLQFTIYSYGGGPDDGPAVLVLDDSIDSDRLLDEYATVQEAQDAVVEWLIDEMVDWLVALYGEENVQQGVEKLAIKIQ